MPVHIQQRGAEQFGHVIAFIELGGTEHFLAQRVGHRLPGFIVARIVSEDLRMAGPVLVDLRRELHKIARCVGARERSVTLAGKQPVQGVTKLVEQSDHIIPGDQRGLAFRRFLIVTDVINHRTRPEFMGLFDKVTHPRPAAF